MWYRTGTVAVTNGSTAVAGAGTAWVANARAGDGFRGPDRAVYEVESVNADGSITLAEAYAGATVAGGGAYAIIPTSSRVRDLATQVADLISDYGPLQSSISVNGSNVGVGTSSPASKFTVAGDARLLSGGALILNNIANAAAGSILFNASDALVFNRGGSVESMRIDSFGNVGVGISAPTARLHVGSGTSKWATFESSLTASSFLHFMAGAGGGTLGFLGSNGGGALSGGTGTDLALRAEQNLLLAAGGNTERVRITSAGHVGIGTPTPGYKLHVSGAGTPFGISADPGQYAVLVNDGTCTSFWYTGGSGGTKFGTTTAHSLSFWSNNSERVVLDTSGNTIIAAQPAPPELSSNGTMVFNLTSSTNLRISVRGNDGVTRVANITLA